jgi:hypothetical protein
MDVLSDHPRKRRSRLVPAFGLVVAVVLALVPSSALAAEVGVDPFGGIEYIGA